MAPAAAAPPVRKSVLRVPVVIGHEEVEDEAAFLDRSNVHASAWVTRVWRQDHELLADFEGLARVDADLIRHHRYRVCSAELYPEPPAGFDGEGVTLRRVALLGGDQAQVKSLGDIPLPEPGTRGEKISGVPIFASGVHRGISYTDADLDQIVENFRRFSPDASPEKYAERPAWVDPGVYLVPRGSRVTPAGTWLVFHEAVSCRRSPVPEKFCGGAGGTPGPCPKGRQQAHKTVRAHANAAAHAAGKTGAALEKARVLHANARHGTQHGVRANERLAAAHAAHETTTGKADRLGKKAKALEHQHAVGQRVKAGKKKSATARPASKPAARPAAEPAAIKADQATHRIAGNPTPEIRAMAQKWADASPGLKPENAAAYTEHLSHALAVLPAGIGKEANAALSHGGVKLHDNLAALRAEAKRISGKNAAGVVGFAQDVGQATHVNLDGGDDPRGTYVHELWHAADNNSFYSDDKGWQAAYKKDILKGKHLLSRYAMTNASEGFAEFGRALAEQGVENMAKKFPNAVKHLQAKGLV